MPRTIRKIRIEGNIAYVPLTQGYEATIDEQDVPLVSAYNWYAMNTRNSIYAVRNRQPRGGGLVLMHREIMQPEKHILVDHKDTDSLNNRRSNLRIATVAQNAQNSRLRSDNTSGVKGVCWHSSKKKWGASINYLGKSIYLGRYDTIEEASAVYDNASKKLHGEFGRPIA